MTESNSDVHEQIARWLADAQQAVAFTGAGISTESGIPDFRSPGGVWSQTQPVYFQDFLADADARKEYWRQKSLAQKDFSAAQPNVGHQVLARWERQGLIRGVITQNIDGLHQDAGSQEVWELHGTARWIACLECGERFEPEPLVELFLTYSTVPECPQCGGLLKHATVSFGQSLPQTTLMKADKLARECDVFFALGSSLQVHPAAMLPETAATHGAKLVIINRDPTPLDRAAAAVIHGPLGESLAAIDAAVERLAAGS